MYRQFMSGLVLLLLAAVFSEALAQQVNTRNWLRDFEQVRTAIARNYADLDESLARQGINPVVMAQVTTRTIQTAESDEDARRAIDVFLSSFGDPRLRLQSASPRPLILDENEALLAGSDPIQVCRALRYKRYDPEQYGMGVLNDYSFNALVSVNNVYGAGIIDQGLRGVGYVRIPSFQTEDYFSACLRAWRDRQEQTEEPCDGTCLQDITDRVIPNMLIDDFARRIESFAERRIGTVLVDLTGTAGSGKWASAIGLLLAGDTLSCPQVAVPRSTSWRTRFTDLRRTLGRADVPESADPLIDQSRDQLRQMADAARETCRRPGALWTDSSFNIESCGGLIENSLSSCGLLDQSPGADLSGTQAGRLLYQPSAYTIAPSPRPTRVIFVVDEETSGTAESLLAMVQDADAADIIGQTTAGSGCQRVDGADSRIILRRSGLELLIPNCRLVRADGSNAALGVQPDQQVYWSGDANSDAAREAIYEAISP